MGTRSRIAAVGMLAAVAAAGCTGGGADASGDAAAPPATAPASTPPAVGIRPADAAVPAAPNRAGTGTQRPGTGTHRPGTGPTAPAGKPVVGRVWTSPALDCDPIWCRLPAGAGSVRLHAQVTGATSVEFAITPTGTDTAPLRRSLGVDRDGRDGWSVGWSYPDEPLMVHLSVLARGPGGSTDVLPFNVTHPEPLPMGPTVGRVWTDPALSCVDGWCRLPAASGTMTISAEIRGALAVVFFIDNVDSEPNQLDRPTRTGERYSVRWHWVNQWDARLRIVAGNNLGQVTVSPLGFRHA